MIISKNLLNHVVQFCNYEDIISLKKSNRLIKKKLTKSNDEYNNKCFYHYINSFQNEEEKNPDLDLEKITFEKKNDPKINWEKRMRKLLRVKGKMNKLINNKIMKIIDFIFKYKIYLPDLRKTMAYIEYVNSTTFMQKLYDNDKLQKCENNYYDKQIKMNEKIIPLRERLYFEENLINLKESFEEIKNNERYIYVLTDEIFEYDYIKIENEYKHMNIDELKQLNPIFCFIWLMTIYFNLYLISVLETIKLYQDDKNSNKLFKEFIKQHNNVMNIILFINSNFNNINIIVNYWNKFLNEKNQKKSEKHFLLMNLFLKMYKEIVYDKVIDNILNQFDLYIQNQEKDGEFIFGKNEKERDNKMDIEKENDIHEFTNNNNSDETKDTSFCSDFDEEENLEINYTTKNILENLGNCILEMELNNNNSHGINHTEIILGDVYNKYEELLIQIAKRNVENNLKKNEPCFDEIKALLESDKNHRMLLSSNMKLINRTKKKLVKEVTKLLVEYVKNNFDINNQNNINIYEKEDFNDFTEKAEKEIKNKVEIELNNIKKILIEKKNGNSNVINDVNNYIDKNGDNIVVLAKKIITFYYKEMQFYQDNNNKVYRILSGENLTIFNDQKKENSGDIFYS